jgi:hypothetical protein
MNHSPIRAAIWTAATVLAMSGLAGAAPLEGQNPSAGAAAESAWEGCISGLPAEKAERDAFLANILTNARPDDSDQDAWVEGQGSGARPTAAGMDALPALVCGAPSEGRDPKAAGLAAAPEIAPELAAQLAAFNPDGSETRPSAPVSPAAQTSLATLAPAPSTDAAGAKPAETGLVPSPPPAAKPRKMFEDRADFYANLAFHVAGAWDIASTIYGIKHISGWSEANPIYLKLFGEKNARNLKLITGMWILGHLSVNFVTHWLFKQAKKQAKEGHQKKRVLLDILALAILATLTVWHIEGASTWYGPGAL